MDSDSLEYRALKIAFRTVELDLEQYKHLFERSRDDWREMQEQRDQMTKRWQMANREKESLHEKLAEACAILKESAEYTDVSIAFRLADLSRDFFEKYPETKGYLQTKGEQDGSSHDQ